MANRRNRYLYDVNQEQASYFTDRMVRMLSEDEQPGDSAMKPNSPSPSVINTSGMPGAPLGIGKNEALKINNLSNAIETDVIKKIPIGTRIYDPELDKFYLVSYNGLKPTQYDTEAKIIDAKPDHFGIYKDNTLGISDNYSQFKNAITDTPKPSKPSWDDWRSYMDYHNPQFYAALGGITLVGAGLYYAWKKWKEKGSLSEEDKAMAKKIDAEE